MEREKYFNATEFEDIKQIVYNSAKVYNDKSAFVLKHKDGKNIKYEDISYKKFLEDIRPIITAHAKTNGYLGKETKYDVWHLNYSGHQVVQILDWLYKDSNYYLIRKYNKYQILKSY